MKKQVDFIEAFRQEKAELQALPFVPPSDRDWQRLELTKELVAAQKSQYAIKKNEERWNQLEHEFYPTFCTIAKMQGGRVELKINEETLIGQIVYTGEELILDNAVCRNQEDFAAVVSSATDIFITAQGDCFQIQFLFQLFDEIFVEDHSKQIAEIRKKIQAHRLDTMLLRWAFEQDPDTKLEEESTE